MKAVAPLLFGLIPQIALAQPPEALWLTADRSVIIATGACETSASELCAVIVGLKDDDLAKWAHELCGLPVFWGLRPGSVEGRWDNGQLLDPATQKASALTVTVRDREMVLSVKDGGALTWRKTEEAPTGCGGD